MQRYENQRIEGYLILLFVHPAQFPVKKCTKKGTTLVEMLEPVELREEIKRRICLIYKKYDV